VYERTSTSPFCRPTMIHSTPGQLAAKLMSVARLVDLVHHRHEVGPDLEAQRARREVLQREDAACRAVGRADDAAALVGRVVPGVVDDAVEELARDPQGRSA
jgi:hypothetical protein